MVSIRARRFSVRLRVVVSVGRVAGLVAVLAGCSYVPDAINPVEWYKGASDLLTGSDRPEIASPRPVQGQFPAVNGDAKQAAAEERPAADSLAGDSSRAHYASPVRREVTPTKAYVRHVPPPEAPRVAAAPAPQAPAAPAPAPAPAAPAQAVATMVSPNAQAANAQAQHQAIARAELGPSAPPAKAPNMTPPPPPDIPATVPAAGGRAMSTMETEYQRRLAESAATNFHPTAAMVQQAAVAGPSEQPIHLHPPRGGRGKGMAAPEPAVASGASSFQVAALDFADANAQLTPADRRALADIAKLYRKTGGTVRVLGHTPSGMQSYGEDIGLARANAVARELVRNGVPARRVLVGGGPTPWGGAPGAQVFLDY